LSGENGKLVEALVSSSSREGRSALASLIRRGDNAAAELIGIALLRSNWPACDRLADALVQTGTDEARTALIQALKGRRHHIRSAAVKALVRIGGPGVREAIERRANDPSYEVRQDVAEALRQLDAKGLASEP